MWTRKKKRIFTWGFWLFCAWWWGFCYSAFAEFHLCAGELETPDGNKPIMLKINDKSGRSWKLIDDSVGLRWVLIDPMKKQSLPHWKPEIMD